jgi:hypothetical protein
MWTHIYDGLAGTGAAASYYPLAAQWDNVAITVATNFIPPQASGNLRPLVSLTSLPDGTNFMLEIVPALLPLSATATDYDGTITKVEFHAGMLSWPLVAPCPCEPRRLLIRWLQCRSLQRDTKI